jgi:hypothetical protein
MHLAKFLCLTSPVATFFIRKAITLNAKKLRTCKIGQLAVAKQGNIMIHDFPKCHWMDESMRNII